MEKINCRSVKRFSILFKFIFICILFSGSLFTPAISQAQVRAGLGYLKMLPGVRGIGVAKTTTGALDFTDSFYANPAAAGFLREWQWSAAYTNWISEVYHAAFLFGKQVRTPWSRHSRFVLAANYLGIPEFTSSAQAPVSGDHLLATVGFGQPLSWLSEYISAGVNLKYFSANLADYHASTLIYDVGLLLRTRRLLFLTPGNDFLDYAIFSAGFSLTNLGESIQFDRVGTPLPRTLRTGVSVNLGAHRGLQMSLAADYQEIRDEDGFFSVGSEISWQQIFSIRMGYSLEDNLLGKLNFGASVRVDDRMLTSLIPGRNNAVRFDLASNQTNEFFATPYHASITHQPIGPENFEFQYPLSGTRIDHDSLLLAWETTRDPDLFDATNFWLVVDSDSLKIANLHKLAHHSSEELVYYLNTTPDFVVNQKQHQNTARVRDLKGGDYFWSVLAVDKDQHLRFAESNGRQIQHFYVTQPRLDIIALNFEPDHWITEDDYQGVLQVTVENRGDRTARNFILELTDSTAVYLASKTPEVASVSFFSGETKLPEIHPGGKVSIAFEWHTHAHGRHRIHAGIRQQSAPEMPVADRSERFCTIPKGTYVAPASAIALNLFETTFELPYFGKIFFDPASSQVGALYLHDSTVVAPLAQFAARLVQRPDIKISLQASIDRNSNEHDLTLADARAEAVRDSLLRLGVLATQIQILPDTVVQKRQMPLDAVDADWLRQENRFVNIQTEKIFEEILFGPVASLYSQKTDLPVQFTAAIKSAAPLTTGKMFLGGPTWRDSLTVIAANPTRQLNRNVTWNHAFAAQTGQWQDRDVSYELVVTDSLQRLFKVRPKTVRLAAEVTGTERLYFVLAQFKYARSYYDFYWSNLLNKAVSLLQEPNTRMQFIGHGCAVGSDVINLRLSRQRATQFTNIFLNDLLRRDAELYAQILSRIDPPEGRGETETLAFTTPLGQKQVLGFNDSPLGRNLNRRVMVRFYSTEKK